MLRTVAFALLCVAAAASPAAAKKKHPPAHAKRSAKRPKALALHAPRGKLARADKPVAPMRVAASTIEPTTLPSSSPPATVAVAAPTPAPAPMPHLLGPQAGDDEVPGSRMKR